MQAAVLYAPGDLRIEDVPIPTVGDEEILVRVAAVGVCGSDINRVFVKGTYKFPLIPGHEFAGVVEAAGRGSPFEPGDRVVGVPMIPCGCCEWCKRGFPTLCDCYDYLGSRSDGAFAEYVRMPERNALRIPNTIDFDSASMIEPAAVALHGILQAGIQAGDCVAILGSGTLGLLLVQWAKILGASRVIVIDIVDWKLELAKKLRADICINSMQEDAGDRVAFETRGQGVDIVLESAGVPVTQAQAIHLVRKKGTVVFFGTAPDEVRLTPATFERVVRRELTLRGTWNSYSAPFPGREWLITITYMAQGRLQPKPIISHHFPLNEALDALVWMRDHSSEFGKVVLLPTGRIE